MRKPLKPCGTHAAYQRHVAHGEIACNPCLAAERRYTQELRQFRRQWRPNDDLDRLIHVLACAMGVGRDAA